MKKPCYNPQFHRYEIIWANKDGSCGGVWGETEEMCLERYNMIKRSDPISKAEERAFERCPDYREMDGGYVAQIHKRKVFTEGYHQAEKDLELSWEDIAIIEKIRDDFVKHNQTPMSDEEFYKEIVKRFKERKEK